MRKIEFLGKDGEVVSTNRIEDHQNPDDYITGRNAYNGRDHLAVSWREVDPAIVAAELAEEERQGEFEGTVRVKLPRILLDLENRVRALEGKPPITREQLVAALRNLA